MSCENDRWRKRRSIIVILLIIKDLDQETSRGHRRACLPVCRTWCCRGPLHSCGSRYCFRTQIRQKEFEPAVVYIYIEEVFWHRTPHSTSLTIRLERRLKAYQEDRCCTKCHNTRAGTLLTKHQNRGSQGNNRTWVYDGEYQRCVPRHPPSLHLFLLRLCASCLLHWWRWEGIPLDAFLPPLKA